MTENQQQVYSTPCYQLTRQIIMLVMMLITVILSVSIEAFQGILNDKLDDILKMNITKT